MFEKPRGRTSKGDEAETLITPGRAKVYMVNRNGMWVGTLTLGVYKSP